MSIICSTQYLKTYFGYVVKLFFEQHYEFKCIAICNLVIYSCLKLHLDIEGKFQLDEEW